MVNKERVEHEGIVKSISAQTLEVQINSHSACAGCHAQGACGMSGMKQKSITVRRPEGNFHIGDKVMVYASLSNAFYSVFIAYIMPSILILAAIFFLEKSGSSELYAAVISLILLAGYFIILYFCRNKIARKISFTVEKRQLLNIK
ncbi:MAG: SoxR reducing system RseC family protein [Odoribacter sp.]